MRKVLEATEFMTNVMKDSNAKKFLSICKKYGYDCHYPFQPKYGSIEIKAIPSKLKPAFVFVESFKDDGDFSKVKITFDTVSYGRLYGKDLEDFVKEINNTFNMIKELEKFDFSKLPKQDF